MKKDLAFDLDKLHSEVHSHITSFIAKHNQNYESLITTLLMITHELSLHAHCALKHGGKGMCDDVKKSLINMRDCLSHLDDKEEEEDEMVKKGYIKLDNLY